MKKHFLAILVSVVSISTPSFSQSLQDAYKQNKSQELRCDAKFENVPSVNDTLPQNYYCVNEGGAVVLHWYPHSAFPTTSPSIVTYFSKKSLLKKNMQGRYQMAIEGDELIYYETFGSDGPYRRVWGKFCKVSDPTKVCFPPPR